MLSLTKVISSTLNNLGNLVVKLTKSGKSDHRNVIEASPYGLDSNPIKGMVAIYSDTEVRGNPVVIGYVNKNRVAKVGESRLFSTDSDGELQFYVWLTNDGKLELGGTGRHLVAFEQTKIGLDNLVLLINAELVKAQAAITVAGGVYAMVPVSVNIDTAKINEITTP